MKARGEQSLGYPLRSFLFESSLGLFDSPRDELCPRRYLLEHKMPSGGNSIRLLTSGCGFSTLQDGWGCYSTRRNCLHLGILSCVSTLSFKINLGWERVGVGLGFPKVCTSRRFVESSRCVWAHPSVFATSERWTFPRLWKAGGRDLGYGPLPANTTPHLSKEEFLLMLSLAQQAGVSNIYKYSVKQRLLGKSDF